MGADTVAFCVRVMVGVIILYDHVHKEGAFAKGSKIDVSNLEFSDTRAMLMLTNGACSTRLHLKQSHPLVCAMCSVHLISAECAMCSVRLISAECAMCSVRLISTGSISLKVNTTRFRFLVGTVGLCA